jgi:hypothetical protein
MVSINDIENLIKDLNNTEISINEGNEGYYLDISGDYEELRRFNLISEIYDYLKNLIKNEVIQ